MKRKGIKSRGIYEVNGKVTVVNYDNVTLLPPQSEWVYCSKCDFTHPVRGHIYVVESGNIVFIADDLHEQLVERGYL